jgi:hypothetical protein
MRETVYVLCALTSLACAVLLLRGYLRSKARLLLWSCLCFAALTLNNVLLFVDKVVLSEGVEHRLLGLHFALWRVVAAAVGLSLLVFGLIWDSE